MLIKNGSAAAPGGAAKSRSKPRQGSATDVLIGHMEALIFDGVLQPGDQLPSEAELAEDLGISRLTVREGIRTFQARGLVNISHGRRATLAHPNAAPLRDFFSASVRRDASGLLELLEVRMAVEVHAASLAALHATESDLAALELALEYMKNSANDVESFNDADVRFHAALARASGNKTLGLIVEGMEEPLRAGRMASISGHCSTHQDFEDLIAQHATIYSSVAARNSRGAAAAMARHLTETRKDLAASFKASQSPPVPVASGPSGGPQSDGHHGGEES
jgi:GntR family transcriptional regulator, transcriptional repressor for pyruvate dehydrogenase complex